MLKGASRSAPEMRISDRCERNADYLALVRKLPCLSCGVEPCGEVAHLKFSSAKHGKLNAFGKRVRINDGVPLCGDDHRLRKDAQHKGSEEAFWEKLDLDPYAIASHLYAQRGDFVAMEQVVRVAIMNRKKR